MPTNTKRTRFVVAVWSLLLLREVFATHSGLPPVQDLNSRTGVIGFDCEHICRTKMQLFKSRIQSARPAALTFFESSSFSFAKKTRRHEKILSSRFCCPAITHSRQMRIVESSHICYNSRQRLRNESTRKFASVKMTTGNEEVSDQLWNETQQSVFLDKLRCSLYHDIIPQLWKDRKVDTSIVSTPLVIILAVSGGCDSVALFHSILQIIQHDRSVVSSVPETVATGGANILLPFHNMASDKTNVALGRKTLLHEKTLYDDEQHFPMNDSCQIHVAHFDHCQRGGESTEDKLFVENLCRLHHIPFHCFIWDNREKSADEKDFGDADKNEARPPFKFSQDTARHWRRTELNRLLLSLTSSQPSLEVEPRQPKRISLGVILTAHHRDDSEETILLKLLRGVHITNISGMEPVQPGQVFAKPMLSVRKHEVIMFLKSQGLQWREDASNESSKYLRNRIRQELIPLMTSLVGGREVLQRRLANLEHQSKKIQSDLLLEANKYLSRCDGLLFSIPEPPASIDQVHEQALHLWVERCTNGDLMLTYEQLLRVCRQLVDYPLRRKWSLDVGGSWSIARTGNILSVERSTALDRNSNTQDTYHLLSQKFERAADWNIVDEANLCGDDYHVTKQYVRLELRLQPDEIAATLAIKKVSGNEHLTFVPPWRIGHSPIKVKEFLRGQKVPLHRRGAASILCFDQKKDNRVIAVHVENKPSHTDTLVKPNNGDYGGWFVNVEFTHTSDSHSARKFVLMARI